MRMVKRPRKKYRLWGGSISVTRLLAEKKVTTWACRRWKARCEIARHPQPSLEEIIRGH